MNICFVGNSVSSQKYSYQKILSQHMGDFNDTPDKNKIINCSLGGIGSLGISFFIDRFIKNTTIDLCFIETFVADLGWATPKQYIAPALNGIIQNKALAHAKIVPLYLYRSDNLEAQYTELLAIYNEVFVSFGLAPINVYEYISNLVADQKINSTEVVYDQIHTTAKGAEIYADFIYQALKALQKSNEIKKTKETKPFQNQKLKTLTLPPNSNHSDALIPKSLGQLSDYVSKGHYQEGRFRLILPFLQIERDATIEFAIGDFNCIGIMVIADAYTGAIAITHSVAEGVPLDIQAEKKEWHYSVQIYDAWCGSSRLQVIIFPEPAVAHSRLTIMTLDDGKASYTANLLTNQTMQVAKNIKIVHLMAYEHNLTGTQPE